MFETLFPHGNVLAFLTFWVLFIMGMTLGSLATGVKGEVRYWVTAFALLLGLVLALLTYHAVL